MIVRRRHLMLGLAGTCLVVCCGCEPSPQPVAIENVNPNLVHEASLKEIKWPVSGGQWQVARPTSIPSIRQLPRGSMGERYAEIQAERQKRIDDAAKQDKPPPWNVDAYNFDARDVIWLKEVLGEVDNQLWEQLVVSIPAKIKDPKVQLDTTGRRMLLLNDSIWVCRLPWRDWYCLPDTPPQESDEPGSPKQFEEIKLPNTETDTPVMAQFVGPGSGFIAAKGKHLYAIDSDTKEIAAETEVGNPIVYLDVAVETGDAIAVDSFGKILLFNRQLDKVITVGKCDLELPMPVISPEAARIAVYQSKTKGRVYKINQRTVIDTFDVEIENAGEPLMLRSGRIYDLWVEKNAIHKRPNYPNERGADRKTFRYQIYWDIQDIIDRHALANNSHSQFCIAQRPLPDGGKQLVAFDAQIGNKNFFKPLPLPDLTDKQLTASGDGTRIGIASRDKVHLYYRILDFTDELAGVYRIGREFAWYGKFEGLENVAKLISALPEDRLDRRPQQMYTELVRGIREMWTTSNWRKDSDTVSEEDQKSAKECAEKIAAWADKKSTLGLVTKLEFHSEQAWRARGGGYSSTVTQGGWKSFEAENKLAMEAWKELSGRDDIPACGYAGFIKLARDTGMNRIDVSDTLKECVEKYPLDESVHHQMAWWLLEKWGGNRGSSAAYAAAVSDAIGSPRGDFVYARVIERISPNYPSGFFVHAQVDRARVLTGLREGIRMNYWRKLSTLESIILLNKSLGQYATGSSGSRYGRQVKQVSEELADYYRQNFPVLWGQWGDGAKSRTVTRYLAR